jgi:hypothetical protein
VTPRCTVLIVNGFDRHSRWGEFDADEARRYPWIELCLHQIEKHSRPGDYLALVYDNAWLPAHRRALRGRKEVRVLPSNGARIERGHGGALDVLVRSTAASIPYVITLDTDAFPIRDGWIDELISALESGYAVSGIYRDEISQRIRPYVHPSCFCARRADLLAYGVTFRPGDGDDVGHQLFDVLSRDRPFHPLRRSNVRNVHPLMGGIYGDLVYHHGAGSRRPLFWGNLSTGRDELARQVLRDAAFTDLSGLIAQLRGERPWTLGLPCSPSGDHSAWGQ